MALNTKMEQVRQRYREVHPEDEDGWVSPADRHGRRDWEHAYGGIVSPPDRTITEEERQARRRLMAGTCHMSVLFGFPFFIVPLLTRDDAFVLAHARSAAVIWALFYAALFASVSVHAAFFAVAMILYMPSLRALYLLMGDERPDALALAGPARVLLGWVRVKPSPRALLDVEQESTQHLLPDGNVLSRDHDETFVIETCD